MLRVGGVEVDLIELFEYNALVQEVETKRLYLVSLCEIEHAAVPPEPDPVDPTTVISLRGWKSCEDKVSRKTKQERNK